MLWTNEDWAQAMWAHYIKARHDHNATPTSFWACVRATIALWFDWRCERFGEYRPYDDYGWREVAWQDLGTYGTAYGTGHAFAELQVKGFTYNIIEDGTL